MPAERLEVALLTPERPVFQGAADLVVAPAWDGEVGILRGHAPMLVLLGEGEVRVRHGNGEEHFHVAGGVLEVRDDVVTILTERAETT